jgi:tetratricopeptide (TPR) repeat protein
MSLWESGQTGEAVEEWRAVKRIDSYLAHLSASETALGHLEIGEQWAELAHGIDPTVDAAKSTALRALCSSWRAAGEPARALPWCELVVDAVGDGWSHIAMAEAQLDMGDYNAALDSLRSAVATGQPDSLPVSYQKMATAFEGLGRLEDASAAYTAALDHGASNPWLYIGLADNLIRLGDYSAALDALQRALEPGQPDSLSLGYQKMAVAYEKLGRPEEAIAAYETALDLGAENAWLYVGLARNLMILGDETSACARFHRAVRLGHTPTEAQADRFALCGETSDG